MTDRECDMVFVLDYLFVLRYNGKELIYVTKTINF